MCTPEEEEEEEGVSFGCVGMDVNHSAIRAEIGASLLASLGFLLKSPDSTAALLIKRSRLGFEPRPEGLQQHSAAPAILLFTRKPTAKGIPVLGVLPAQ